MIIKSYKFRFYPTTEQIKQLDIEFNNARFVWNHSLSLRIKAYNRRKESINYVELSKHIKKLSNTSRFGWLKQSTTACLTQKLIDLDKAFNGFFKKKFKFPRFKKKSHEQKVRYQLDKRQNNYSANEMIKLPKLGELKVKWHRKVGENKPKMVTVTKAASGHYFISFSVEENQIVLPRINKSVGIDLGIKSVVVDSDGFDSGAPRYTYKYRRKLKKAQRRLAKMAKGSNRWKKQRIVIAKIHQKISNCRRDFLHKLTSYLVKTYQFISIEDLNVSGMLKNHNLAKAIADVGMYEFKRQLEYKAKWYGREITIIDRWFPSSQLCSSCGKRHKMPLSVRVMNCDCGLRIDRDLNAAININRAGKVLRGESYHLKAV